MVCIFCGAQISDDSVFCTSCGTALNNNKSMQWQQPVAYSQPVMPRPVRTKKYIAPEQKKKFAIIGGIAIAVIALIIVLVKIFGRPDLDGTYEITKYMMDGDNYTSWVSGMTLEIDGDECEIDGTEYTFKYSKGDIVIKKDFEVVYRGTYDKKDKEITLYSDDKNITMKFEKGRKKSKSDDFDLDLLDNLDDDHDINYIPAPSDFGW